MATAENAEVKYLAGLCQFSSEMVYDTITKEVMRDASNPREGGKLPESQEIPQRSTAMCDEFLWATEEGKISTTPKEDNGSTIEKKERNDHTKAGERQYHPRRGTAAPH